MAIFSYTTTDIEQELAWRRCWEKQTIEDALELTSRCRNSKSPRWLVRLHEHKHNTRGQLLFSSHDVSANIRFWLPSFPSYFSSYFFSSPLRNIDTDNTGRCLCCMLGLRHREMAAYWYTCKLGGPTIGACSYPVAREIETLWPINKHGRPRPEKIILRSLDSAEEVRCREKMEEMRNQEPGGN